MRYVAELRVWMLTLSLCAFGSAQTDPLADKDKISPAAKEELKQGVQDYKQDKYGSAIGHFREATKLAPEFFTAHLYLATALSGEYHPGVNTPENVKLAEEAIETYQQALSLDPKNVTALKGLGFLELDLKRFEDAKSHFRRVVQVDPNDPEAFYSVGVVDETQAYERRMEERSKWGLSMMSGPPSSTQSFCPKLRADTLPLIKEGLQVMKKAIELRADYHEAMSYVSFLFYARAEIQCSDRAARSEDMRRSIQWLKKSIETKRKAEVRIEPSVIQ